MTPEPDGHLPLPADLKLRGSMGWPRGRHFPVLTASRSWFYWPSARAWEDPEPRGLTPEGREISQTSKLEVHVRLESFLHCQA